MIDKSLSFSKLAAELIYFWFLLTN